MPNCSGLLTKRGTGIKTWHKRHFNLQGVSLTYFTEDGAQQKGEYIINSDTTVEEAHLRRNCFSLVQHGRTLYMSADTLPEKDMWMACLHSAIAEARQLEVSKRQSFKKRELSNNSIDSLDDEPAIGLDRISEITTDTSFCIPSPVKTTREVKSVPKSKNPVFSSFESKLIHFHLMNARNLFSKGSSDTFARITVGAETKETAVIKRDLNPSWDETFSFEWNYTLRYAKIEVWDVGTFTQGERFLGVVFVPIIPVSSMTQVGKWYKLGKRSVKSHVSGEIYIDAYCDECYDFYPLQILDTVQSMQDLRGHVSDAAVIVPHTKESTDADILVGVGQVEGRFMMQFPPTETETLEDICMSVTMKPTLERGKSGGGGHGTLFCDGILLMTNYRLIFVSNSRLLFNQSDFLTLDADLTTSIPLTTVVSCVACSEPDPHDVNAKVFHDGIIITTNDSRSFTFLFYENAELDKEGNVRTNRHASQESMFSKYGEEKMTATLSTVSNEFRYLDANDSVEGCPSKRFLGTLERKGFNRVCELHASMNVHHALICTLQHDSEVVHSEGSNYDEPALNSAMLKWLKSLPPVLRTSYRACFLDGWQIYNPKREFKRMGVPDDNWRLTEANSSYELCDTYPSVLAVPSVISDSKLGLAALFRSRGRLPVLCWRHPLNLCSITRSSQPLVGMQKRQSPDDEALLLAINQASATGSNQGIAESDQPRKNFRGAIASPFVVFDARPKLNATANQAAGKGYEMSFAYKNCQLLFMNIDNIHVMRKSLDALEDHCRTPVSEDSNWYSQIEGSGWLVHVNRVLVAAVRLVHCICKEQLSVLVHCSDGWDRTAQLTSLAMLMMDPFYRTYSGFQILIEKEWLSFGHKFGDRLGWSDAGWSSQERSPVFMQFLDCVHQLLKQNPNIFEFNEDLLVFIMHQTQTAWFGNFLLNSEKDRKTLRLSDRTVSLWSYVIMNFSCFGNPHYVRNSSDVWIPVTSIRKTLLWDKWFLRWHDIVWKNEWNRKNEDFSEMGGVDGASDVSVFSQAKDCHECHRRFTMFLRRSHCFHCKNVFCEHCLVSKPDIHRKAHLFCRNCFDVYEEEINAELSGISENVLMHSGMTRRVLGSASDMTLRNRLVEEGHPQEYTSFHAGGRGGGGRKKDLDHVISNTDELRLDLLPPLTEQQWQQLDEEERLSYVQDGDEYVDLKVMNNRGQGVPPSHHTEKKPSVLHSISSKFTSGSSSAKKLSKEDAWAAKTSGLSSPATPSSAPSKTSTHASPKGQAKRFIPFSNEMMTRSSAELLEQGGHSSRECAPPLAKKYSSTSKNHSPAREVVTRSHTLGTTPRRSPVRRQASAGSPPRRSSSRDDQSDQNTSRSPPRRTSSRLLSEAPHPSSSQQISILPPESEEQRLRRKSSGGANRFDMYKKTSVDLSKNKSLNRKNSSGATASAPASNTTTVEENQVRENHVRKSAEEASF